MTNDIPTTGQWPVDPQEDQPIDEQRIWIDGCFDFFHHGHAGVMLQARQLGRELIIGIHSDEAILDNKGPTVMSLKERVAAVDACRWTTKSIPNAPYVTQLPWLTHYGCKYVVHGDDITSDGSGEDCYRFAKKAGRFKVVKRTPGISTTDLVGRMLLCTKSHFISSLENILQGYEGPDASEERMAHGRDMYQRIRQYASDETGLKPWIEVHMCYQSPRNQAASNEASQFSFRHYVDGSRPFPGQRLVYVDGGFDLFSSGHIEFLNRVSSIETERASRMGWYTDSEKSVRLARSGTDYGPAFVIAGLHDDLVINKHKGLNYPIMNIFERGLCLIQCRYIHSVVFGAPFEPNQPFLEALPYGQPDVVYHGPTAYVPLQFDPYVDAKRLGIFEEVPRHDFQDVDAGQIVSRITNSREIFEARQRKKGIKGLAEADARRKEIELEQAN